MDASVFVGFPLFYVGGGLFGFQSGFLFGELLPAFVELFPLGGEFLFRAFEDVQRGHFYRPFCFVP